MPFEDVFAVKEVGLKFGVLYNIGATFRQEAEDSIMGGGRIVLDFTGEVCADGGEGSVLSEVAVEVCADGGGDFVSSLDV